MKKYNVAIIVGSIVYSGSVLATAQPHTAGPSWEIIAVGAVGLFVSAVGWYAKGVSDKVTHLDSRVTELNTVILKEYHPKSDVREMINEVRESMHLYHVEMKANMNDLKQRFDKFESIYGR